MEQLLTNEYQRIWWQEKETWDRLYTKKVASKNLLQRMVKKNCNKYSNKILYKIMIDLCIFLYEKVIRRKPPSVPVTITPKKIKTIRNKKGRKPAETVKDLKREPKKEEQSNDVCGQEKERTEKTEGESTKEAA